MAYQFVGASNQFISVGSVPTFLTGGNTRSVGFKFRVASPATRQTLFLVGATSESGNNRFDIEVRSSVLELNYFSGRVIAATTLSADTWYNFVLGYSSGSVGIYLNGVLDGSASVTLATGSDRFNIGAFITAFQPMTGHLAELAGWSADIGTSGREALADDFSPSHVSPASLEFYIPFVRNLQDVVGALALTNNNTATVSDHPRVYA